MSCWSAIGAGSGWLLANIGVCIAAYALTSSFAILESNSDLVLTVEFICSAVGATLGVVFGAFFETRNVPSTSAYSDVRTRRLQDYCAWWLGVAPMVSSALTIATLWMIFRQSSAIRFPVNDAYILAPTLPSVGVLLVIAALIPALSALCIHWIVASPRMLLAANPIASRGADDFHRATGIGLMLGFAWIASGCLLQAVVTIEWQNHVALGRTLIDNLLSVPFFLGTAMCITGGCVLPLLRGRLGGTLTGWRNPMTVMRYLEHGQEL